MTNKLRTKACVHCGDIFTESRNDSNSQWGSRKFCSYLCLNRSKDHSLRSTTTAERYWRNVVVQEGCWGWKRPPSTSGRAIMSDTERGLSSTNASRVSWEIHNGPIPDGLCVLHQCDNPMCTNPAHLFLGTQADNIRDMHAKGRANNGGHSRLSRDDVQEIRALSRAGVIHREIAHKFGVSRSHVNGIVNGRALLRQIKGDQT